VIAEAWSAIRRALGSRGIEERGEMDLEWQLHRANVGTGSQVTPQAALTLAAAYACINVIATDVAMLPLEVFRRRKSGGRDQVRDDPRQELLGVSPDRETTSMRWRQAWVGHTLGWGNGFNELTFSGGVCTGIYLLNPGKTQPRRRPQDKRLYYQLDNGETLPPYRVLHLAGLGFDGLCGYSPIRLHRRGIEMALAIEQTGLSLYTNNGQPKGVLTTEKTLSDTAYKRLKKDWHRKHGGPNNAGKVAILEDGLKFQATSINPEDAEFLATRQFQVIEVCRLYRVPPNKVADMTQSHLANIESSNIDYVMTTLVPWCRAIEQELNWKLFTPAERARGYYVKHDVRALLRGDMKSRAEYFTRMRDLGAYTPNMVLEIEDENPIGPEGDLRLVPLNMQTLEAAGRPPEPAPQPPVDPPVIEPAPVPAPDGSQDDA
jgi:HK97 family phage portal protein